MRAAGQTTYNYVNPPRRDVVALGVAGDNVTIRWVTDNAGPWYLHWYAGPFIFFYFFFESDIIV